MGPGLTHAEGFILGVGAKMLIIAGPIIGYSVSASVVYGLICWITTLFQYKRLAKRRAFVLFCDCPGHMHTAVLFPLPLK